MRLLFFIAFCLLTFSNVSAQSVKIKKGLVYIDGVETLKVSGDANNVSFNDLDGNEVVFLRYIHNSKYADVYIKVVFLDSKQTFTNKSYIFTRKDLIKKLVEGKVLVDGKIDPEKAERFTLKYDEDVENESLIIEIKH